MAECALAGRRVFVAGHRGMVGSAIVRRLAREGCELLTLSREALDLRDQGAVHAWMESERPEVVVLAAATVGGIVANDSRPADFLFDNLAIATNVIHASHRAGVAKLLYLGSSCAYPRHAPQPIAEEALLGGPLEPTNQWYAVAKIAGVKLTQAYRHQHGCDFIAAMPTNLYGPGDNFDLASSHVLPALLRKVYEAKQEGASHITIWGSGTPRRDFLHVDDCAEACMRLLTGYSGDMPINIGSGTDIAIRDLAALICEIVGFAGEIRCDPSKPDGTPRKLLDTARIRALGWAPSIALADGIAATYRWFVDNGAQTRARAG